MRRILRQGWMAALGAMMALAGCGGSNQPSSAPSTPSTSGGGSSTGNRPRVVGFVQTGNESGWRRAHTKSIMEEGKKRGIDVKFVDAESSQEKQISAIRTFVTQKVDAIILAPVVSEGWDPVLREAKDAGVPVFLSDRSIVTSDDNLYVCFVGSDFVEEGRLAGEWLAKKVNGKARIVELVGTPGSAPAVDRATGFRAAIKDYPEMQIIDSQSGDFVLEKGKQVMEAMIKKFDNGRGIDALFAHNDDMALGAIQAIREAGLKPGQDIIIVSIDALKTAFEAMVRGELNCTVSCNPLLGPAIFDAIEKYWKGEQLPKKTYVKDTVYPQEVAAELVDSREY